MGPRSMCPQLCAANGSSRGSERSQQQPTTTATALSRLHNPYWAGHGWPLTSTGCSSLRSTGVLQGYSLTIAHSTGRPKFRCGVLG